MGERLHEEGRRMQPGSPRDSAAYGADPTKGDVMAAGMGQVPAEWKPVRIPENHRSQGDPVPNTDAVTTLSEVYPY